MPASPVSIVVEWENALLSDADRSVAMLRAVRQQTLEIAADFELLVVFDETRLDARSLSALFQSHLGDPNEGLRWRLVPVSERGYYGKKHHGVTAASGEIVVFIDSDVIPEAGWLKQLLGALEDPAIDVVFGNTYIDPVGLVGKTFALTWFFPLRSDGTASPRGSRLFVNNLAIRRAIYERYPFQEIRGSSRGACLVLADELTHAGVPMLHNPRARAAHPAPNGFAHVSLRALAQGRDRVLRERTYGNRWSASWLASLYRLARHQAGAVWTVATGFRKVGLNPLLVPAAATVASYYYLLYWAGETMLQLRIPVIRQIRI